MFKRYLELGGTEIANAARVATYVEKNAPQIPLRARWNYQNLHVALGEPEYESPAVDDAPWVDPSMPETARFYGVYPLSISGAIDSTRSAETVETIGGGGATGAERYGSKAIRVRALLVAEDDLALEAGNTWLSAALASQSCDDHGSGCGGAQLCYFAAEPKVGDCWETTYEAGFTVPVAADVIGSPLIIREPNSSAIYKAWLDSPDNPPTSSDDGVILRWGTVSRDDTSLEVEQYGPIIRQRTNLFPRPNLLADDLDAFWDGAAFTVVDNGTGPDGRAYANTPLVGGSITVSSDTSDPVNVPAGPFIVSVDLRGTLGQSITLELKDPTTNAVLTSAVFIITDEWVRYSLPLPTSAAFYVSLTTTATFQWAGWDVEAGNFELPYLDGNIPWQVAAGSYVSPFVTNDQYEVTWLGTPNKSKSRLRWLGQMTVGMAQGEDFWDYGGGACNTWPFIDVLQGEISGGRADFAVRPMVPIDTQVRPYERTMHQVRTIEGPIEIETLNIRSGGAMRTVEWTMVADKPWAYSSTDVLIHPTKMSELPTLPWPGAETIPDTSVPPIIDPDCIVPPTPPRPPTVPAACIINEPVLYRYWLEIPAAKVSLWSDSVVRVILTSGVQDIRQVRARVFPNPFDRAVTTARRENTSRNPKLGVDTAGWGRQGGIGTNNGRIVGVDGPVGPDGQMITTYQRITATGAHAADTFGVSHAIGGVGATNEVAAGQKFRVGMYARPSVTRLLQLRIGYVNAAGTELSVVFVDGHSVTANAWEHMDSGVLTAPANTVRLNVATVGQTAAWATSQTLDATGVSTLVATSDALLTEGYVDGDMLLSDGFYYSWMGTDENSRSLGVSSAVDPYSWCSEFVLSYLPPKTELIVDAILERAFASVDGGPQQAADTLLYASDGGPMTWPALSCGVSYLLALDVPEPLLDDVTVSIELARKA